jgi:hypothetical protein
MDLEQGQQVCWRAKSGRLIWGIVQGICAELTHGDYLCKRYEVRATGPEPFKGQVFHPKYPKPHEHREI